MISLALAIAAILLVVLSFVVPVAWLIPVSVLLLAVAILAGHWAPTTLRR